MSSYNPQYTSPPSETLKEFIEEGRLKYSKDLSIAKEEKKIVDDIIFNGRFIDRKIARILSSITSMSSTFWNRRQRLFRQFYIDHQILEPEIYNFALTPEQIKQKYIDLQNRKALG